MRDLIARHWTATLAEMEACNRERKLLNQQRGNLGRRLFGIGAKFRPQKEQRRETPEPNFPLLSQPWTSAHWEGALRYQVARIEDIKAGRSDCSLEEYENFLLKIQLQIAVWRLEEAERPTWTVEHWAWAEARARHKLEEILNCTELPSNAKEEHIANAHAEIEFFQRPQNEKLNALLEGVSL